MALGLHPTDDADRKPIISKRETIGILAAGLTAVWFASAVVKVAHNNYQHN